MMHAGAMVAPGPHLTVRGILGMLATAALDRLVCLRLGHDPVEVPGQVICRRCLNRLP